MMTSINLDIKRIPAAQAKSLVGDRTIQFAYNSQGTDKNWDFEKLATGYQSTVGTVGQLLNIVSQGWAISAGTFGGRRRSKANFDGSQILLLDIDNSSIWRDADGNPLDADGAPIKIGNQYVGIDGQPFMRTNGRGKLVNVSDGRSAQKIYHHELTWDEAIAHPFLKQYGAFLYTSASHTEEWHRFRIGLILPEFVTDIDTYEILVRSLMGRLPNDPACKDGSRVFYGNTQAKIHRFDRANCLPQQWVDDAIAEAEKAAVEREHRIEENRRRAAQMQIRALENGWDKDQLVQQALSFIPAREPKSGNYQECLTVLQALHSEYGDGAIAIAEAWSPSIKGDTWNIPKKIRSFRRSGVGLGSLFYIAQQHGFEFPKGENQKRSLIKRALDKVEAGKLKLEARLSHKPKKSDFEGTEYKKGDRLQTWQRSAKGGVKYILDLSKTGHGKTFNAGNVNLEDFGVNDVFYITDQQRNPTNDTLKAENGWVGVEARHDGLIYEDNPDGSTKLRRKRKGEAVAVAANCNRNQLIGALREKNLPGADTSGLACAGCPLKELCSIGKGPGYGYLGERRDALASQKKRIHPDSLPNPVDYDYSKSLLIWDEPAETLKAKKNIKVYQSDVEQLLAHVFHNQPEFINEIGPLINPLLSLFNGEIKGNRYGVNHQRLLNELPALNVSDEAIAAIESPDLKFLNSTAEHGVDLKDLPRNIRKQFAPKDSDGAETAKNTILKRWLSELLPILKGDKPGYLNFNHKTLTISIPSNRNTSVLAAAQTTVFLDATLSREDLALMLGCNPEEIAVVRQRPTPTPNLKVQQVIDMGALGQSRGEQQLRQVETIKQHYASDPGTKVIDFKKFDADGAWWIDSRGVNTLATVKHLVLIGKPCPNIAELLAEYSILKGEAADKDNPEFKAWVDRKVTATIRQGIGRLRANRRLSEELTVTLVTDHQMDLETTPIKASDITIDAASKTEQVELAIKSAVATLHQAGQKITQTAIAKLTGYSQGYISRFRKLLQTLLDHLYSKSNNSAGNSKDMECADFSDLVTTVEMTFSDVGPPPERIPDIHDLFLEMLPTVDIDPGQFFGALSKSTQQKILEALALTLEPEILSQFS